MLASQDIFRNFIRYNSNENPLYALRSDLPAMFDHQVENIYE